MRSSLRLGSVFHYNTDWSVLFVLPDHMNEAFMAAADKRAQIMQAAEKLFASRRFHEVTTDDIARSARVGKGTIYRYFQDKDDLFFQMAMSGFDELCELLRSKVSSGGSFLQQLLQAVGLIEKFFDRRHQILRLMHGDGLDGRCEFRKRWLAHRGRLVSALGEIVAMGVPGGEVRSDIPPEVLANFLMGMMRTRAHDLGGQLERFGGIDVVVQLFCNGVACSKPRAISTNPAAQVEV